ncbi:MAG: AMP-binding protein [Actinomycetota bacterium]|nr:AMP-binding protein [Actinomycetota bacterium]MDI7252006.1 AMP-binding protein [Actinomycetota bacterium]
MTILTDLYDRELVRHPEYVLLNFEERTYTNLEIYQEVCRIGHALLELGLEPGQVLLVHMENVPEFSHLFGACAKTGIIFCPTMFLISAEELSWMAEHSEAAYVATTPNLLEKVRLACPRLFERGRVILCEGEEKGLLNLQEMIREQPETLETRPDLSDDDVAAILYTSGTTGRPKGVMLTHRNLGSNAYSVVETNRVTPDEVALSALPLSHSYGLTVSLLPGIRGLSCVLMRWFDAEEVFRCTERYHIRSITGVPTMFIQLLNHPHAHRYNVRSWKRLQSGAAPLPEQILMAFKEKFGVYIYEGYGLTEASPVVSCQRPDIPMKPGSVGPPIHGVEVSIRDNFERELPSGSPGEICVRGPNVMKGYFKEPAETERALRGGWLHTGDIGYLDEDGYLYIVERKKDLIITGGFNLYPSEVEQVLERHPAVREAAVVGEPDPVRGEVVHAFVVLEPDRGASEGELIEFARKHLVYYKVPHRITFLPELPRTILGKPSRKELRDRLLRR